MGGSEDGLENLHPLHANLFCFAAWGVDGGPGNLKLAPVLLEVQKEGVVEGSVEGLIMGKPNLEVSALLPLSLLPVDA